MDQVTSDPETAPVGVEAAGNLKEEKYRTEQTERRTELIRPSTPGDLAERDYVSGQFVDRMHQLSLNIPLRFHGTPSYELKQILESGVINSGEDRIGVATSFGLKGEISVTSLRDIEDTIGDRREALAMKSQGMAVKRAGYIGIIDEEVPLGCVFVLMPNTPEEAYKGENAGSLLSRMSNVNLRGARALGVLTSEEFKSQAERMISENGYKGMKVLTYREFAEKPESLTEGVGSTFPWVEGYKPPPPRPSLSISL